MNGLTPDEEAVYRFVIRDYVPENGTSVKPREAPLGVMDKVISFQEAT
ncbi:hypothetical protein GCM10007858_57060 [Bradyrhizobium liaoningense]|nr:hypothetical protein GCM10007858_57060 [Bradyrhizobium liaoningense]